MPPEASSMTVGALVSIPLPDGVFSAIWVTELVAPLTPRGKRQLGFLVLDRNWPSSPTAAELTAAMPGEPDVWKGCFWGAVPGDFTVVATKRLSAKQPRETSASSRRASRTTWDPGGRCRPDGGRRRSDLVAPRSAGIRSVRRAVRVRQQEIAGGNHCCRGG